MTYSSYTNINGETDLITPWYLDPYDDYGDQVGNRSEYRKRYTKIREIPTISSGNNAAYWESAPYLQCKLSTWNVFNTSYSFIEDTLKVFVNGIIVPSGLVTVNTASRFTLDTSAGNGYLYADYNPLTITLCVGDNAAAVTGARRVGTYYLGSIRAEDITRCRQAINAMQVQSDSVPSTWIGGSSNNLKSGAKNIIVGASGIYGAHIREIQAALISLSNHLSSIYSGTVTTPVFTEVVNSDNYAVQLIEEIRVAINYLETILIAAL